MGGKRKRERSISKEAMLLIKVLAKQGHKGPFIRDEVLINEPVELHTVQRVVRDYKAAGVL